jgi:hypothetical protein
MTEAEQPTPETALGVAHRVRNRLGADFFLTLTEAATEIDEFAQRFAAQRAAEAARPTTLAQDLNEGRLPAPAIPPSGDAGERARVTVAHAREIYYSAIESHARSAGKVTFPPSRVSDDGKRVTSPSEYIISAFATALQSERTAAASEARRVIEMWDPRGDRWDNIPYDNPTIKALMLRALTSTPSALPVTREDGNG